MAQILRFENESDIIHDMKRYEWYEENLITRRYFGVKNGLNKFPALLVTRNDYVYTKYTEHINQLTN